MTGLQLIIGGFLLLVAASEAYAARTAINKLQRQVDRMHDHLLLLMRRHGVDPLE